MLNPKEERCYSACELARLLKKEFDIEKSHSTLLRWMRRGRRGIKLESIPVGGQRYSSLEAVQRFFERLDEE